MDLHLLEIYTKLENGKGCEAGRGHATPHMPAVVTKNRTKCVGGSCAVYVDLQAVGTLEFFGELYRRFCPIFEGFGQALEKGRVLFFSNHQHFPVSTGICGVACPLPASRVDKPLKMVRFLTSGCT